MTVELDAVNDPRGGLLRLSAASNVTVATSEAITRIPPLISFIQSSSGLEFLVFIAIDGAAGEVIGGST